MPISLRHTEKLRANQNKHTPSLNPNVAFSEGLKIALWPYGDDVR